MPEIWVPVETITLLDLFYGKCPIKEYCLKFVGRHDMLVATIATEIESQSDNASIIKGR